jgi:hypothetical protein
MPKLSVLSGAEELAEDAGLIELERVVLRGAAG